MMTRAVSNTSKTALPIVFAFLFLGCESVGPTMQVSEGQSPHVAEEEAEFLQGEHCGFNIFIVPVTRPSLTLAIERALLSGGVKQSNVEVKRMSVDYRTYSFLFPWRWIGYYSGCISVTLEGVELQEKKQP
mgnify:CR=1 FL=1|tara:strand:- start:133 stop:525 length:393 start_codon:yes stop_codon:yes gene_type:complete